MLIEGGQVLVKDIKDNVITLESSEIENFTQGEIIKFSNGNQGYLLSAYDKTANVILFDNFMDGISVGAKATKTGKTFSIDIPREILGKI